MEEVEKIVTGFIKFLRTSGKLHLLPQILKILKKEAQQIEEENTAVVTSAQPLGEAELTEIEKELIHLFGHKLTIINEVNPNILGGFIIRVADRIVDLSLNNYLEELKEKITHENN